ncbi:Hypothetical predicted protein [Octopus vulgaris]|uniref:Uncharacterized protein n=1 Tax=Octopus vulgaris TaxID=6645 RepID=A0AA36B884_OCTVU|nr:Hypothetical predicted protein [Octopus vulgaris]
MVASKIKAMLEDSGDDVTDDSNTKANANTDAANAKVTTNDAAANTANTNNDEDGDGSHTCFWRIFQDFKPVQ